MIAQELQEKLTGLLKDKDLLTDEQISFARQIQNVTKESVGELLERLGFITRYDLLATLAELNHVPYLDLDEVMPDDKVLAMFNKNILLNNVFLPINIYEQTIDVAAENPSDPRIAQLISSQTGLSPVFYLSDRRKILNAIHQFYYFLENPVEKTIETEINILSSDTERVRGMDSFINHVLHLAVKMRATDVHLQPLSSSLNIAFRIDSVIRPVISLPKFLDRVVSSIKMKAEMDIAEQRLPQDGRFSMTLLNNAYDFRVFYCYYIFINKVDLSDSGIERG